MHVNRSLTSFPHSFLPATKKTGQRRARIFHMTPSFLNDDNVEPQSHFNLLVSTISFCK